MRYVKDESGRVLSAPDLDISKAAACRHKRTVSGEQCLKNGRPIDNISIYMTICKRCGRIMSTRIK